MKTKTIIALLIAIVAVSACKKEETSEPVNEITVIMTGDMGAAIVFDGRVHHRMNTVNHYQINFSLPIGENFTYRNRKGNSVLTVYVNGEKKEPVIQLSEKDLEYYEYIIDSATMLMEGGQ